MRKLLLQQQQYPQLSTALTVGTSSSSQIETQSPITVTSFTPINPPSHTESQLSTYSQNPELTDEGSASASTSQNLQRTGGHRSSFKNRRQEEFEDSSSRDGTPTRK